MQKTTSYNASANPIKCPMLLLSEVAKLFRVGVVLFVICSRWTEGAEVIKSPTPEGVLVRECNFATASPEELQASGGYMYLLDDHQVDIEKETVYRRQVVRLLTVAGVESFSRLMFEFEPSYQKLRLHRLRIYRDGETLDRLPDQQVDLREQEARMKENHYNGFLTAELLLRDIRVGDTLEWAYSIQGRNPIFNGKFHMSFGLSSTVSKRDWYTRIVYPQNDDRTFRVYISDSTEEGILRRDASEVHVHLQQTEPVSGIDTSPSWYFPYPWFEISEYADWRSVVEWALPLYGEIGSLPTGVDEELNRISRIIDPAEKIAEALLYVQKTLRYVSVSLGIHTHKPYPMEEVFDRGYGDCKDKALLLSSLLRSLGFNAWPALVHTTMRHTIKDELPSPGSFNHVIVAVEMPDGDLRWIDPTRFPQVGPLDSIFTPAYGYALLLRPGEEGLVEMNGNGFSASRMHVEEIFTYPASSDEPVEMQVESTYEGLQADNMRSYLEGTPLNQIQDEYQEYYHGVYGETHALSPLRVNDDTERNRIQVWEHWSLTDPWKTATDWEYPHLTFQPVFSDRLSDYPTGNRGAHPYALSHPRNLSHRIQANLPFTIPLEVESFKRDTPHFVFTFRDQYQDSTYLIDYTYRSKADYVPAEDLEEHTAAMKEIEGYSSYRLADPWTFRERQEVGWMEDFEPVLWLHLLFLAAMGVGVVAGLPGDLKHRPPVLPDLHLGSSHSQLKGIGGWLILPMIGLGLSWLIAMGTFFSTEYALLGREVSEAFLHAGGNPPNLFGCIVLVSDTLWYGILLTYLPLQLVRTFRKSRRAPAGFIGFYLLAVLNALISWICAENLSSIFNSENTGDFLQDVMRSVIVLGIWSSYFKKSVRVKQTFVR